MNPQRINVFNETYGYHIILSISYHFQFKLFPAQYRFFHQHLSYHAGLKASGTHSFQLFHIIYKASPCTSHGVGGTQDNRISQFLCNRQRFLHRISHLASGHLDAQTSHGFLEFYSVFPSFNGVYLYADYLYIIFLPIHLQLPARNKGSARLSSQIGKKCVGALLLDNLSQPFYIQRFDISYISSLRVCHNGRGIGIDQYIS